MPAHSRFSSYEEAVAAHRWDVPERYNIAQDVCDKHPPEKLAMLWEDYRGNQREVNWGELQDASNRLASVFRAHGVEVGDRVAMLLTPRPETAAAFLGAFKAGAILLSLSVLYGDDGIRHRVTDSQAKILVTNAENIDRVRALDLPVEHVLVLDESLIASGDPSFERVDTRSGRPRPALLHLGHHGPREGHPPRAPVPARAQRVRAVPRRPGRGAVPRDGRVGVGGRHRAAARPVALRRGAGRLRARGRLRPGEAARVPLQVQA